jgi:hypothetical protein
MNAAADRVEGNAKVPVLYMALELSDKTRKVVFGDGVRRRQVAVPAGGLVKLHEAVAEAKERATGTRYRGRGCKTAAPRAGAAEARAARAPLSDPVVVGALFVSKSV